MTLDIRLKTNIFDNPKIKKLIWKFGSDGFICLLKLWMFTAEHRPKGILYDLDKSDIKMAMGFPSNVNSDADGTADRMLSTFLDLKFLNFSEKTKFYSIHEWKNHNGFVFYSKERKKRAFEAAKSRWKHKRGQVVNAGRNANGNAGGNADSNAPTPTPTPTPIPTPIPVSKQSFKKLEIEQDWLEKNRLAYPRLDVIAEAHKADAWLIDNPRKKHKDHRRFLKNWLERSDKALINNDGPTDTRELTVADLKDVV